MTQSYLSNSNIFFIIHFFGLYDDICKLFFRVALVVVGPGTFSVVRWRDGGEGAAVVAAVEQLHGELEVRVLLAGVRVQAHGADLGRLEKEEFSLL
jgi:hypothetical protein